MVLVASAEWAASAVWAASARRRAPAVLAASEVSAAWVALVVSVAWAVPDDDRELLEHLRDKRGNALANKRLGDDRSRRSRGAGRRARDDRRHRFGRRYPLDWDYYRRDYGRERRFLGRERGLFGISAERVLSHRARGDARNQHHGRRPCQPARTAAGVRRGANQPTNAVEQRPTRRRKDEPVRISAELLEIGQRPRIGVRITTQAHREVVAAVLALDPDTARKPPDGGVIEEQRLDQRL